VSTCSRLGMRLGMDCETTILRTYGRHEREGRTHVAARGLHDDDRRTVGAGVGGRKAEAGSVVVGKVEGGSRAKGLDRE